MRPVDKILAGLIRQIPNFLGLVLFFGAAYVAYFTTFSTSLPFAQLLFLTILIAVSAIRIIAMASDVVFSPFDPALRLLRTDDGSASAIHRSIVWASGYMIAAIQFSIVAHRLGAERDTTILLQLLFITLLLVLAAVAVIIRRKKIREHFLSTFHGNGKPHGWWQQQFAAVSSTLVVLYLSALWLLLVNDTIAPDAGSSGAFLFSFFLLPIWMVADRMIQWLVLYAMGMLKIHRQAYDDAGLVPGDVQAQREKGKALFKKVNAAARIGLVFALTVWVASLWNIPIPLVSRLSSVLFDSLVIMTLALLFWQFISSWTERKIRESVAEEPTSGEEPDDEWGPAAQRGRSYTLLPIIRKFIGTLLAVMVTLTILSSMGVDIGPLLAGAGVVGLAIGFGAQKLVADVLSGFFYLLDDAFRVGEYIMAGSVSGMVEGISLRNVMLRHHRGMLQIIPHSELGAITNYMRGGITEKFNLDFPYDADIDQIRKVIKKVGAEMMADGEMGKDFLKPLKSQGVREIANSVMTIRVKFTAKPGAHFIIRREAFKRITEALKKKGIHYAHKKVIVDIPSTPSGNGNLAKPDSTIQAAGAAARLVVDETEKPLQDSGT
jgi:small-conductance mechanosensitive channel